MKITAIPRENMNSVSTRVHYYYYLNNLPNNFVWEHYNGQFGDVLYVQKKADDKTVKIAKKARKLGVPVVYDCDDNPYERQGKRRITMLRLATAVTCDTDARAMQLKTAAGIDKVTVIPECVDYYPMLRRLEIRPVVKSLVTFGNNSNTVNALKYLKKSIVPVRHINSKKILGAGAFVKWKYKTFVDEMLKSDVCFLAHGDNLKSDLKMLVCVAMGMPLIVSDTKSYREFMDRLSLSWLVAKTPDAFAMILRRIQSQDVRLSIVASYNKYDMAARTPQMAAKKLADVFVSVVGERLCR